MNDDTDHSSSAALHALHDALLPGTIRNALRTELTVSACDDVAIDLIAQAHSGGV
jgi:hypothetical protein